jgi:hypothetical protein
MTAQINRWPTKPRKGQRCDNTIGSGTDMLGGIILNRCANIAVETVKIKPGITDFSIFYLCEDCLTYLNEQGKIMRNPKRKIK